MGGATYPSNWICYWPRKTNLTSRKEFEVPRNTDIYIINQGLIAESLAMDLSRKLRNYDLLVELDLSGAFSLNNLKRQIN